MNIDFVDGQSQGFLDLETHRMDDTIGDRFDARAIFDDHIQLDVDILTIVDHFDAVGGVFDQRLGDAGSQVLRSKADDAI